MSLTKKNYGVLAIVVLVAMTFMFAFSAGVSAEVASAAETAKWLTVSVDENGDGTITAFNYKAPEGGNPGSPTEITIPTVVRINNANVTIKAIGHDAFLGCNLNQVVFEEDSQITSFAWGAFRGNPLGNGIAPLPKNLTTIGDNCFRDCSRLPSIDFTGLANLKDIPASCFYQCGNLRTVNWDEGIKTIGNCAFYGCPITRLEIPASVESVGNNSNTTFASVRILDLSKHEPGRFPLGSWSMGSWETTVIWSDTINSDNSTCFYFNTDKHIICGLKPNPEQYDGWNNGNITIPNSIGNKAVLGFNAGAFFNKNSANVKSVSWQTGGYQIDTIPYSAFGGMRQVSSFGALPEGITTIEGKAFDLLGYHCAESEPYVTLTMPDSLVSVGEQAFDRARIETINFPGSALKTLHAKLVGDDFGWLKEINFDAIPRTDDDGNPSIAGAPWNCQYATINWADGSDYPQVVVAKDPWGNDWEYNRVTKTLRKYLGTTEAEGTLTVPNRVTYRNKNYDVTKAGESIVLFKTPVRKVVISDGITEIGVNAFISGGSEGWKNIKEVEFPDTLKTIGNFAFTNNQLTTLKFPDGLEKIGDRAFSGIQTLSGVIEIPGNMTEIAANAFYNCPNITAFDIQMYRYQDTDEGFAQSGYVPATENSDGVYKKAPWSIIVAPYGAPNAAVFYRDQAGLGVKTFTVTPNVNNNTVTLTANVRTNANNVFVRGFYAPLKVGEETLTPKMPAVTMPTLETVTPKTKASTASMTISAADNNGVKGGNGTYHFGVNFGTAGAAEQSTIVSYELNAFHDLKYDMNGGEYYVNNAPQTSFVGGNYVTTSKVAALTPIVSDLEAPAGKVFAGWNTRANGSGTAYTAGQNVAIGENNVTLYAQWEDEPEDVFGGGDDGLSGDGKADNTQILVQYLAPSGNGTVTSTPKFKVINDLVADSTNNTVTTTAATATANSGYAFDNWSNNINSSVNGTGAFTFNNVKAGTKIEVIANFAEDIIGGAIGGGDQIPDKYQVQVTYRAGANGKLSGANLEGVITEVKSAAKVNGLYANTVSFTGQNITPVANSGYALHYWQTNRNNDKSNTSAIQFSDVPVGANVVVQAAFISTAAKSVEDLIINTVPADPADVTLEDEEAINAAKAAFDALSDEQKAEIDPEIRNQLNDAVDKLNELKAAAVEDQINNLPAADAITAADADAINAAKDAYDALTDAQKAKVSDEAKAKLDAAVSALKEAEDTAAANAVKAQIEALPAVDAMTLDDEAAVVAAREAYDALTDAQKAKVDQATKDKLEAAEAKIAELKGGSGTDDIDVSKIDDKNTGATIVSSTDGSFKLTVTCDVPCLVAYTTDNGTSYTRVAATQSGSAYTFTLPNGTAGGSIAIVKKGDVDMKGNINRVDYQLVQRHAMETLSDSQKLNALQLLIANADESANGVINRVDYIKVRRVAIETENFSW